MNSVHIQIFREGHLPRPLWIHGQLYSTGLTLCMLSEIKLIANLFQNNLIDGIRQRSDCTEHSEWSFPVRKDWVIF